MAVFTRYNLAGNPDYVSGGLVAMSDLNCTLSWPGGSVRGTFDASTVSSLLAQAIYWTEGELIELEVWVSSSVPLASVWIYLRPDVGVATSQILITNTSLTSTPQKITYLGPAPSGGVASPGISVVPDAGLVVAGDYIQISGLNVDYDYLKGTTFSGNTPDTSQVTYSWVGAQFVSASIAEYLYEASLADLEYDYLGGLGATGTLNDRRFQIYGENERDYFAPLSGLTPPEDYSLADHMLAYYLSETGLVGVSLSDAAYRFFEQNIG